MKEMHHYYELAEAAAGRGEVTFLRYCVDEILRESDREHRNPDYSLLFKTFYEARLFFLNQNGAKAIPDDLLAKLRELDDLTDAVQRAADGAPIADAIRKIRSLAMHPITPMSPKTKR